jgi:hypothetical protein
MVLGDYFKIWHFNSHGKGVQTIPFLKENKDPWLTLKGTTPFDQTNEVEVPWWPTILRNFIWEAMRWCRIFLRFEKFQKPLLGLVL